MNKLMIPPTEVEIIGLLEFLRGQERSEAVTSLGRLVCQRDRLKIENARLRETVAFFACTIKCGEPWAEQCEQHLRAALDAKEPGGG